MDIQVNLPMTVQNYLREKLLLIKSLTIYRNLLHDPVVSGIVHLLAHLRDEQTPVETLVEEYCSLYSQVSEKGTDLETYLALKALYDENPFTLNAEKGVADNVIDSAAALDLEKIRDFSKIDLNLLLQQIAERNDSGIKLSLPPFQFSRHSFKQHDIQHDTQSNVQHGIQPDIQSDRQYAGENDAVSAFLNAFYSSDAENNSDNSCFRLIDHLRKIHNKHGCGIFLQYSAFIWEGCLRGITFPDTIRLSDLIGYTTERQIVIDNTEKLLKGLPANNILLYGDRGTGKSSTVKAILNEYKNRGLRLVEVPKDQLHNFPVIIETLRNRNYKFIIYVDDLAYEDNEEKYTGLKTALEGGIVAKPGNIVIYATSNRRHLVKEKFSDRAGLMSTNPDDEIHLADTLQEKLSLSDRFGLTVTFSAPGKKQYLEIVKGLAQKRGLKYDPDYLEREALIWELRYNGKSPRTAKQFVDWLDGRDTI